jgi:hypothetical protein
VYTDPAIVISTFFYLFKKMGLPGYICLVSGYYMG